MSDKQKQIVNEQGQVIKTKMSLQELGNFISKVADQTPDKLFRSKWDNKLIFGLDIILLLHRYGITVDIVCVGSNGACVGYSPDRHLWFGWDNRSVGGFDTREKAVTYAIS